MMSDSMSDERRPTGGARAAVRRPGGEAAARPAGTLRRVPVLGRKAREREQRRAATATAIMDATRALLRDGEAFPELSVEQIASRAGISRTAFYDYFGDKRELLIKLIEAAAAPIVREADELQGGRPSGPAEIPFTIRAAMAFARDSREVFLAAVDAASYDPVVSAYWRERFVDRFVDVIERRIRRQQERGIALPIEPRPAATALVLMVVGTLHHHVSRPGGPADDDVVDTLVTIAVRAVYGPVDA
jgi:TetR/AcrR family transcriptional regulator, ethionamide resistance regulator